MKTYKATFEVFVEFDDEYEHIFRRETLTYLLETGTIEDAQVVKLEELT